MSLINTTMIFFVIFSFAVSSGIVSEKSGQLNIAINGMMIFGALFGVFGHIILNEFGLNAKGSFFTDLFSLLFASIGGIIASFLLSFATLKCKGDPGVSATALNILSPIITLTLSQVVWKDKPFVSVQGAFQVAISSYNGFNFLYFAMVVITILILILTYLFFKHTTWGLHTEALGNNSISASYSGIKVLKYRFSIMCFSGALAGLAGGGFLIMNTGTLMNSVGGIGFIALCMIAISRWKIVFVPLTSLLLSLMFGLSNYFTFSVSSVPKEVFEIIPFIFPFIALLFLPNKSQAPREIGKSFKQHRR